MPQKPERSLVLSLPSQVAPHLLLQGLQEWQHLGLLDSSVISLEIEVDPDCPFLLEGLETFERLGLLSSEKVRVICRGLSCPLPKAPAPAAAISRREGRASTTPQRPSLPTQTPSLPTQTSFGDRAAAAVQALVTELSVMWLLVLGVSVTLVGSGILAAQFWDVLPPIGQYAILFAYTLGFWRASVRLGRHPKVRLATGMLEAATLLLVPANFWAIDSLYLWGSFWGWLTAAAAAISLGAIALSLLRLSGKWLAGACILLSFLHWGWRLPGFPLVALYIGTPIVAATAIACYRPPVRASRDRPEIAPLSPEQIGFANLIASIAILCVRSLLVGTDLAQLGLALGIFGSTLGWLSRRDRAWTPFRIAAIVLLALGWLVGPPWHRFGVSCLVLFLLFERLLRLGRRIDLTAIFFVSLQTGMLAGTLIPQETRKGIIATTIAAAGDTTFTPQALFGISLFPYLLLALWGAWYLRRTGSDRSTNGTSGSRLAGRHDNTWFAGHHEKLARHAEWIALGWGTVLACVSFPNSTVRTLNAIASALTLLWVTRAYLPRARSLIYALQIATCGAIASSLHTIAPQLSLYGWGVALSGGAIVQWVASGQIFPGRPFFHYRHPNFRLSCYHMGLALSAIACWVFFATSPSVEKGVWFAVPAVLTVVARQQQFGDRRLSDAWVLGALVAGQFFVPFEERTLAVSLGAAVVLGWFSARRLAHPFAAIVHLGFAVSWMMVGYWQLLVEFVFSDSTVDFIRPTASFVFLFLFLPWLFRHRLQGKKSPVARSYRIASDVWGTFFSVPIFGFFSLSAIACLVNGANPIDWTDWEVAVCPALVVAALAYRTWQAPRNFWFYFLAATVEVWAILAASATGLLWPVLGIFNFFLASATQIAGDFGARRRQGKYFSSWHVIPTIYALCGLLCQPRSLEVTSGLFFFAAGLAFAQVGRRGKGLRSLTYIGLACISVGAYQELRYVLSLSSGDGIGDGVALLAALGIGLAFAYRALANPLAAYLRLSPGAILGFSRVHWVLAALLCAWGWFLRSDFDRAIHVATTVALSSYAFAEGKGSALAENDRGSALASSNKSSMFAFGTTREGWVYAGILEALWAIAYLFYRAVTPAAFWQVFSVFAFAISPLLYRLPWQRWGWPQRPWQRSAIVLPGAIAIATFLVLGDPPVLTVLGVAGFYLWLAKESGRVRYSYLSVVCVGWEIYSFLIRAQITEPFWYLAVVGFALLFVAQIDPYLRAPDGRRARHWLRFFAAGLFCVRSAISLGNTFQAGLLGFAIGIGFILLGLAQRVRAFLYVGTVAAIAQIVRLVWLFASSYSFALWSILTGVGLLFIWTAVTFETRRTQILSLLERQSSTFQGWE